MPHIFPIRPGDNGHDDAIRAIRGAPEGRVVTLERRLIITDDNARARIAHLVLKLKAGWKVKVAKRNRSLEQNALLWTLLTDLSKAKPDGRCHTPETWKCIVMHAAGHEVSFENGLDGRPFPVGFRSSNMTVAQMSELIEYVFAYGATQGVEFSEPRPIEHTHKQGEAA